MAFFKINRKSRISRARRGTLTLTHGRISSPFFMPIATRAAVKSLAADDLKGLGAQIVLSNTYHLWQRPGLAVIRKAGSLHRFMSWPGPILTDSGGYQVFSLARRRKIKSQGVEFISSIDGQKHLLTPEKAINIQLALGSDISMSLDECPPYPASQEYVASSLALTLKWAKRGKNIFQRKKKPGQKLFGIVQGSVFKSLREQSAKELVKMDFDGYAVGGLAVGEPVKKMYEVLGYGVSWLPENKPRYLMGVGRPEQIVEGVKSGIDMFDCVIPTRNARHGLLYVWKNRSLKGKFYQEIRIKKSKYLSDLGPLDKSCRCYTCSNYSKAYLRHLFMSGDPLAYRLASLHNLKFYLDLMAIIRNKIASGSL